MNIVCQDRPDFEFNIKDLETESEIRSDLDDYICMGSMFVFHPYVTMSKKD